MAGSSRSSHCLTASGRCSWARWIGFCGVAPQRRSCSRVACTDKRGPNPRSMNCMTAPRVDSADAIFNCGGCLSQMVRRTAASCALLSSQSSVASVAASRSGLDRRPPSFSEQVDRLAHCRPAQTCQGNGVRHPGAPQAGPRHRAADDDGVPDRCRSIASGCMSVRSLRSRPSGVRESSWGNFR